MNWTKIIFNSMGALIVGLTLGTALSLGNIATPLLVAGLFWMTVE